MKEPNEVSVRLLAFDDCYCNTLHVYTAGYVTRYSRTGLARNMTLDQDEHRTVIGFRLTGGSLMRLGEWLRHPDRNALPKHLRTAADYYYADREGLLQRTQENRDYFQQVDRAHADRIRDAALQMALAEGKGSGGLPS